MALAEAANGESSKDEAIIRTEVDGPVTILTMVYRPYNLVGPALSSALIGEFNAAKSRGSRAVLLRSGLRHFSAGADLTLFADRIQKGNDSTFSGLDLLRAFEELPMPIVTSIHGVCLGGGLELALASDYIIAAESAKIGSVESALGLHPLMGGIQRQVQRAGIARAKEMSMLGRRYDPATLERWGLINLVVPDEGLEKTSLAIAQELARGPTIAHAATKRLAAIAANDGVEAADLAMVELQKPVWSSEDLKLGLASFMANGPGLAKFQGN